ncbi:EAL domain-containing protein [Actinoplanes utahensis]|uniref:EAL domain-containing protein n=1 Tax=Actinoplanes utahensis TaxID=1869 RepID=UPI00068BDF01|nr:EAL domain-containing protein [Actinoplanes utahensis]GIF33268.1 hypothetical protein Aut01nite_62540 [Actinoplanes utahensis]
MTTPTGPRLPRKLGEIGIPMTPLPAGTPVGDIAGALAADTLAPGVIIEASDGYRLLSRAAVDRVHNGPGTAGHRTAGELTGAGTLGLAADTDIDMAAEAALARPAADREEPVLVRWPDGRYGIAPIVDLLAAMAGRFARLSRTDPLTGLPISVEAGIGVSHADHHDVTVLMRRAAAAVRRAKHERTGVVEGTPRLHTNQRVDLRQLTELRAGLRSGHLRLHYQPLHDATTRRMHGAEALVRWQHPQRGLLPPGVFLPDAERSDVILELADWVLAEALHQAAVCHGSGLHLPVSVNLPPAYLAQDRAVDTILTLPNLAGVSASMLTVESTETAVLTRQELVAAQLAELRARGIRVAIDDFGTGYTSLGLLPALPIDELKIDRSFVIRMHDSPAHATIIESVIAIARSLGLTVVAEGVEDEPTAADLATAGVDLLQGFGLNRPHPPELIPTLPALPI